MAFLLEPFLELANQHCLCEVFILTALAQTCFSHQIDHTCDLQRRSTRRYQLMWVTFILTFSLLPDFKYFFFLFVLPSFFILCVSRLYCRLCCHLSWPVTVLSTSLESSKIWMLPQSWKTSKLTSPWHTNTPSAVQLFFVLCHRGCSWLTTSATFIVILLWSCSPRIPQMQLYITQLVCWKPPKTENVFKAKPKNGAYTWK